MMGKSGGCSFSALMLAGTDILSNLGFAIGFGVFLAAFVLAMFFTPALTALAGDRAWWPQRTPPPSAPALPAGAAEGDRR
jgi:putative drug exporter of the RND superfamily